MCTFHYVLRMCWGSVVITATYSIQVPLPYNHSNLYNHPFTSSNRGVTSKHRVPADPAIHFQATSWAVHETQPREEKE